MTTKTTRIIDLNLFSGSSELLRQAAGGYYGDLAGTGDVSFRGAGITDIGGVESIEESEVDTTSDTILPKVKYASRLYVDEGQGFLSWIVTGKHLNVEVGENLRSDRWKGADHW